jgi:hypothetical protein
MMITSGGARDADVSVIHIWQAMIQDIGELMNQQYLCQIHIGFPVEKNQPHNWFIIH